MSYSEAKIRLQVDALDLGGFMSYTEDVDKIKNNIDLLGSDFSNFTEIYNLLAVENSSVIGCVGDYVCLLHLHKDLTYGFMLFLKDRMIDDSLIEKILSSKNIISEIKIKEFMSRYSSSLRSRSKSDLVVLSLW